MAALFRCMSKILPNHEAEIEVNSLAIGAQTESEFAPFLGIVYDPKSDMVEVLLEGWDHTIFSPREVFVDHDGIKLKSVMIMDGDGIQQIVRLREPLALPALGAAA
ncbi:DUF5335 family protein [Massilia glaciei]|uniref:DUF5335 family protein n=1 Tax=Massilia glaciei TaxID=1524097 RepID=UPI00227728D4|nr:DUF5335 family protein [Massilia glaciei]